MSDNEKPEGIETGRSLDQDSTSPGDGGVQPQILLVRAGYKGQLARDFVRSGIAAVAWSKLGDLSMADSVPKLEERLRSVYPEGVKKDGQLRDGHWQLIRFLVEAQTGGWVVTVDSARRLLILGRLVGGYRFLPGSQMFSGNEYYRHARPVRWEFVVDRDKISEDSNKNLIGGQKTTDFLKRTTVEDILTAPTMPLKGYLGRALKLDFAQTEDDVRCSLWAFNDSAADNEVKARRLARETSYWVYDPVRDLFGPAKFVGFKRMGFPMYVAANDHIVEGAPFDGYQTRTRIADVLQGSFQPDPTMGNRLISWAEGLVGAGALGGIDKSKWRFIRLGEDTGLPIFDASSPPDAEEEEPPSGVPERRYWAIIANPDRYGIQEAMAVLTEDTWHIPVGDASPGDRLLIWKAKGSERVRGIVGLGEVIAGAEELPENPESHKFYGPKAPHLGMARRIRLRYVVPPQAPLWEEDDRDGVLEGLAVVNARWTKLYKVTPDQWDRVVEALGGWPDDEDVMQAVASAGQDAEEELHARATGQGYVSSPERRKAIEMRAMTAAEDFFNEEGYAVRDTSANRPYDLVCTKGGELLYVEVKGTTTDGEKVILTKNEVEHARAHKEQMVLFILHGIQVDDGDDGPMASGGTQRLIWKWSPSDQSLVPLSFQCTVSE